MHHFIGLLLLICLSFVSSVARAEYVVDGRTAKLADCGDVMAYAANYALMTNNEGQARVFFFQHARALAALFAKNYDNGVISGERTSAWKARGPATKRYLDANQESLSTTINGCYPVIQQAVDEPIVRDSKMWGKSFAEIVETLAAKTRAQYGLH